MAKKELKDWTISKGSSRTVYDRETGEKSKELVAPWHARHIAGAELYAASEDNLREQIASHPYSNDRIPASSAIEVSEDEDAD